MAQEVQGEHPSRSAPPPAASPFGRLSGSTDIVGLFPQPEARP
jgi:hypothetical protein